jgi:hypothetical protein
MLSSPPPRPMATALDRAVARELDRIAEVIATRHHRALFGPRPGVPMFFVFTHQYGIEAELFHTQEAADAEAIRLKHLSAYRQLNIHVGRIIYDISALEPERNHQLVVHHAS